MIDERGYRLNVGIILVNSEGKLLWAQRVNPDNAWQFPQGGMHDQETPLDCMYRELHEELGLEPKDIEILAESKGWYCYQLPKHYRRYDQQPVCIGQKQKWFLLQLLSADQMIKLDISPVPEFSRWLWVDYWQPLKQVISFKRSVYRAVLKEFERVVSELKHRATHG